MSVSESTISLLAGLLGLLIKYAIENPKAFDKLLGKGSARSFREWVSDQEFGPSLMKQAIARAKARIRPGT